jgi:peptidoglycan/LPS O-acetylase OafA/YrhL
LVYVWRDKLPWNAGAFALAATITLGVLMVPGGDYLVGFPAAYATVYLGLLNPRRPWGADYSYGLYLYGFVIQQTIVALFPWSRQWAPNFVVTMIVATGFAAASWHFIEKPAQKLKKHLPGFEARFTALRAPRFREA